MSEAWMQFEGAVVIKNMPLPLTPLRLAQETASASLTQSHQTTHEVDMDLTLWKPLQSIMCPVKCSIFWTWLVVLSWHHLSCASIFRISCKLKIKSKVKTIKPLF